MPFLSGVLLGIFGLILIFPTTFARLGEGEEAKNEGALGEMELEKICQSIFNFINLICLYLIIRTLRIYLYHFHMYVIFI